MEEGQLLGQSTNSLGEKGRHRVRAERAHPAPGCETSAAELLAAARFGIPEPTASYVHRPRLLDSLARRESLPLVLVSGPAGSGKTSTVADWVRRRRSRTAATGWIAFEDGDAFWANVLECLRRLGLEVPAGPGGAAPDAVLGREQLLALVTLIADQPQRWTVVLDGYELTSIEVAREVDYLLRHTFGHLCLVFVSRVDPVLQLYRYRLEESLGEVRAADLEFTDPEAADLLSHLGVSLGDEAVHELNERVRGWAAGLRFAARALAGRENPESALAAVVAQAGDINEYLVGEVLEAQPPEVRRFLLDTCVPDLLYPGLLEELAGPGAVHNLDSVARSNAFIEPVPDQPGCYRYYPFFRELLRAQLAYESPEKMADLHRRAAGWFEREGLTERSIGHLATIGAWDAVATQMVNGQMVGRVVLDGGRGPIGTLARQMPPDLEGAAAAVVRAAGALSRKDRAECADQLRAARRAPAAHGLHEAQRRRSIAVLDAVRGSLAEDAENAAALCEEAGRVLGVSARSRSGPEEDLYALAQLSEGIATLRRGDLTRARKALTTAAGLEPAGRFASFRADCLGYLAVVDALGGYLSRAGRTAVESLTSASEAGHRSAAAHVALAFVALEHYELKTAREHVSSAVSCSSLSTDPIAGTLLEGVVAGLDRASGHPQQALDRLEAAATAAGPTDPWLADRLSLEVARLNAASGRAELALDELAAVQERQSQSPEASVVAAAAHAELGRQATADDLLALTREGRPALPVQVSSLLVEVAQEVRRPAPVRARAVLERSLGLAASEGLRRPFFEAGPAVQRLLSSDPRLVLEHPWLSHHKPPPPRPGSGYRGKVARAAAEAGPDLVETLTPKELEVLGHLEELLTTEEIAVKMFVSVNTVRTHVRSILRKLGVTRRNAAVRKARELGLFAA